MIISKKNTKTKKRRKKIECKEIENTKDEKIEMPK